MISCVLCALRNCCYVQLSILMMFIVFTQTIHRLTTHLIFCIFWFFYLFSQWFVTMISSLIYIHPQLRMYVCIFVCVCCVCMCVCVWVCISRFMWRVYDSTECREDDKGKFVSLYLDHRTTLMFPCGHVPTHTILYSSVLVPLNVKVEDWKKTTTQLW